ncbi:hypothetical protein [Streptomyces sp. FH025]|uniref:hypothetical protein n=1 Tax=Streptomyces sp. FH025 TaxID=2815937 RepID=UPI001A9F3CE4|nr:hypothetical protein [Streptomyces sp. FH025]MBO1416518.1 hypothetical protein [Streptomyces sp. FH025]
MSSRIPGRRRAAGLAGFAGLVLTVGLTLTGCDPSAADGGAKASAAPTVTASPTAPPSPTAAVPTAPAPPAVTPTTVPDPAPTPTGAATPATPPTAHPQSAPAKAPQPKVTTAQPPTDPEPEHTTAAGGAGCEIRSNAGNCYAAGQFCRDADLGRSTHDANGRMIYCRMVSGKPHWQA